MEPYGIFSGKKQISEPLLLAEVFPLGGLNYSDVPRKRTVVWIVNLQQTTAHNQSFSIKPSNLTAPANE